MAVKTAIKNGSLPYCKKSKKKAGLNPTFLIYLQCIFPVR